MTKQRLDQLLVERGLAPTRHKAQALIMSGEVLVDEVPHCKAGQKVSEQAFVRLRQPQLKYVSRGGEKIQWAFDYFQLDLRNAVALDVGASTGGFTDCMLQRGAELVYAVDVGTNQLDYKLRADPRVVVHEKTHVLNLSPEAFAGSRPHIGVIDVSFIGLRKILKSVVSVLEAPFFILALVKPQFELGPEYVSKGGVVKEEKDRLKAVELVEEYGKSLGLQYSGFTPSPLKGEKKGNQEYFVCFSSSGTV